LIPRLSLRGSGEGRGLARSRTYSFMPAAWQRKEVLKWLKRTHAWLGFWGALLAFFFSFTGILLNHRVILPIDLAAGESERWRVDLPVPRPADAAALADWLAERLNVGQVRRQVRVSPAKAMPWGEGRITQPEQWRIHFEVPDRTLTAIYWTGDGSLEIVDYRPNLFMTLNRLHRANGGVGPLWVLITDTVAGALIVLSLTGILLWTKLHGRRLLAVGLGFAAPLVALACYLALL
jgi:hypothetical protein